MSGRHHKTTHAMRNLAVVSASGAFAVVPFAGAAHADEPTSAVESTSLTGIDWSPIINCESGGNPTAQNPRSTASGLFEFLDSTWSALGGTEFAPRAKDATPAQQTEIADRAYARSGLSPWDASRSCWSGKVHTAPNATAAAPPTAPPRVVPAPAVPAPTVPAGGYVVRHGDTLSSIAAAHGFTWQQLWDANRAIVANPNLIFAGERLTLPAATPAPAAHGGRAGAGPQPGGSGQMLTVELTGYGYQDNNPPGSATISHPVLHKLAGGTGTFDDPITVAVPNTGKGQLAPGTRLYLPSVKRYVIVEDGGASPAGPDVDTHLDLWLDGHDASRDAGDKCENAVSHTVHAELNPPPGRPVIPGPVFTGGVCHI